MNKNFLIFNKANGALEESEVKLSVFDLENLYVDTFTNSLYVGEDETTKIKITDVINLETDLDIDDSMLEFGKIYLVESYNGSEKPVIVVKRGATHVIISGSAEITSGYSFSVSDGVTDTTIDAGNSVTITTDDPSLSVVNTDGSFNITHKEIEEQEITLDSNQLVTDVGVFRDEFGHVIGYEKYITSLDALVKEDASGVPTTNAVRLYVDTLGANLAGTNPFKGVLDCSTNPLFPVAEVGDLWVISEDGKIGGASGRPVVQNDSIRCLVKTETPGDLATVGENFAVFQGKIDGAVIATDLAGTVENLSLVVYDGTSGKLVKSSGVNIGDLIPEDIGENLKSLQKITSVGFIIKTDSEFLTTDLLAGEGLDVSANADNTEITINHDIIKEDAIINELTLNVPTGKKITNIKYNLDKFGHVDDMSLTVEDEEAVGFPTIATDGVVTKKGTDWSTIKISHLEEGPIKVENGDASSNGDIKISHVTSTTLVDKTLSVSTGQIINGIKYKIDAVGHISNITLEEESLNITIDGGSI